MVLVGRKTQRRQECCNETMGKSLGRKSGFDTHLNLNYLQASPSYRY